MNKTSLKSVIARFIRPYAEICHDIGLRFDPPAVTPRSVVAHGLVTAYYLKVLRKIPDFGEEIPYFSILEKAEEKWLRGYRVEDLFKACKEPCIFCSHIEDCVDAKMVKLKYFIEWAKFDAMLRRYETSIEESQRS